MGQRFYSKLEVWLWRGTAYLLTCCIVAFGPIIGVIAAGIEFGAYDQPLAQKGEALRVTASYVIIFGHHHQQAPHATQGNWTNQLSAFHSEHQQKLIASTQVTDVAAEQPIYLFPVA